MTARKSEPAQQRRDAFILALYELSDGWHEPPRFIEQSRVLGQLGIFTDYGGLGLVTWLSAQGFIEEGGDEKVALTQKGAEYARSLMLRKVLPSSKE